MDYVEKLYNNVFDVNGEIKLCGRNRCKDLIFACQEKFGKDIDFGSISTGMMNVENIKKYVKSNA
jgi:hypothetical protein